MGYSVNVSETRARRNAADQINYVNIGLMGVSAVAAFLLPFHVFLFSYAVLGPLHYLTEISWLHEKRYFTRHRQDYLLLIGLAVALLCLALSTKAILKGMTPLISAPDTVEQLQTWGTAIVFTAFASALAMYVLKKPMYRAFAFLFILVTAVILRTLDSATIFFSIFLPTLIHVFVFTGAFVLFGALKSRSRSGILSFVAFVGFPVLLWLVNDAVWIDPTRGGILKTYDPFAGLNVATIKLFHLGDANSREQVFLSGYGLLIMRFIAYAYTYHYLNWFSKTSVIRWHKVPKVRLAAVGVLWIGAISLYAYDYKVGVIALYCLSFMHVFLEFPLNHLTFLGIGTEVRRLVVEGFSSPAATATPLRGEFVSSEPGR